ncbi:MAG: S8 family serine peptidase [Fimbriimonadales bacterium]
MKLLVLLITLIYGLTWQANAQMLGNRSLLVPQLDYAPGQLLVKFRPQVSPAQREWARQAIGAQRLRTNEWLGTELWQVNPSLNLPELCRQIGQSGWFEAVEPNWRVQLAWTPNDTLFPQQNAMPVIRASQAWDYWRGAPNFVMAIVDTGVDRTHPDLQARLLPGYDFGGDANGIRDSDPSDPFGHGTYVAGIAGAVANNGLGVAGVAPEGKILPVKVFRDSGYGFTSDFLDGLSYAVAQGAHAVNLSLGSTTANSLWETAINNTWNAGVVVVAAAGNNNNTDPFYPAWYANCIAVAACNLDGTRSSVSTYGSWVDMAAPSGDVYSLSRGGGYSRNTAGYTSYAAPFVTAQASMLYALVADGPSDRSVARAQAVRQLIESTAVPVPGNYVAHGRLNLEASILRALTVPVAGRIIVAGYAGTYTGKPIEVQVLSGSTTLATVNTTANATGQFSTEVFLNPSQLGYRTLRVRASGTLYKRVTNARMRYPGVSGLTLNLVPGDVNGDNVIDDADLLEVLFRFGQTGTSHPADLDGNGTVDDADLLLVLFNFGQTGE